MMKMMMMLMMILLLQGWIETSVRFGSCFSARAVQTYARQCKDVKRDTDVDVWATSKFRVLKFT